MKAVIVANGHIENSNTIKATIEKYDYIIACDGGAAFLKKIGIRPNLMVGDFDSLEAEIMDFYQSQDIEILTFPINKNLTDSHLAINIDLERGFTEIDLYGATGSRLDYTLSNCMLLFLIEEKGGKGKVIDENNMIMVARKRTTINQVFEKQFVSLVAIEDSEGITLEGFKYPLIDATLKCGDSLCMSNEMIKDTAVIQMAKGKAFIFITKD